MQTPESIGEAQHSVTSGAMKLLTAVAIALLAGVGILFALGVVPSALITSFALKLILVCSIIGAAVGLISLLTGAPRT